MRAVTASGALAALALGSQAACLSGPDGVPRAWPPALATLHVVALAVGDVDGDAAPDAVIVSAGTVDDGAGIYLARGGAELAPAAAVPLTGFASYQPLALDDATATVLTVGGAPVVVIAYAVGDEVHLRTLAGAQLGETSDQVTGQHVTAGQALRLFTSPFPGNKTHLVIVAGTELRHLDTEELATAAPMFALLPAPTGSWMDAQVATGYRSGQDAIVVVGTAASVQRATVPTQPPPAGSFTWIAAVTGKRWLGEAAVDLTSDSRPEVIAFEPGTSAPGKLCAVDPTLNVAPCADTPIDANADVVVLPLKVTPDAKPDAALVHVGSGAAQLTFAVDLTLDATTLTTPLPMPPTTTAIHGARLAVISNPAGDGVLLVGTDGASACYTQTMDGIVNCH